MKHTITSILMMAVMTLLLGFAYPLAMTGMGRAAFPRAAGGSIIRADGTAVGSDLVGQLFASPGYFHGRPSANNYDGLASGGSNDGPTKKSFIDAVAQRAALARKENGRPSDAKVPADLVLASGSGLDPHISEEAALFQAGRVAGARGMKEDDVVLLIGRHREKRYFGLFGDSYINVLVLNRELDAVSKAR